MNLDDLTSFQALDTAHLLARLDAFSDRVAQLSALAQRAPQPTSGADIEQVLFLGDGAGATGAALAQALAAPSVPRPIATWQNSGLPAWVNAHTLVVALLAEAPPPEVLAGLQLAQARNAFTLAIAPATVLELPCARWVAAPFLLGAGETLVLALALLAQLGLVPDPAADIAAALPAVRAQHTVIQASSPVQRNPAKRLAGQLMNRWGAFFAADALVPVAHHWQNQIALFAKAGAYTAVVPDLMAHTLTGTMFPETLVTKQMALFFRSAFAQPRNQQLLEVARSFYMTAGFNTDVVDAHGPSALAQVLTALHYGDFVAYYLAMAYGIDPNVRLPELA